MKPLPCSSSATTCGESASSDEKERIKAALKKPIPAAILVWTFRKLSSREGLTSRKIIGFLKQRYNAADDPRKTGRLLGKMLRSAVDLGLLVKCHNRFFLANDLSSLARLILNFK